MLRVPMERALWRAFLVLCIVAGIVVWLLTLAQESRAAALEESLRQTALLEDEIAAHRRTDADLHKAKGVAESANLAKSRFVVGVAHELRTPLNAVLGYAQLLEFDAAIPEGKREAVRTIRRSGEHLARLIEGLLDISRIEAGRIQIEQRPVHLEAFLSQIVDMFRLQADVKGIGFTFDYPAVLPAVVRMDEIRLRQVLLNLLSNAVKFTVRGGVGFKVVIRSEVMEFLVTDTGPGIAPDDLDRIFEPFERLSLPDYLQASGIGLGLTISRLLTAVMGGEIQVSSRIGEGSAFRLRLLLPTVAGPSHGPSFPRVLRGYAGRRRTLVAADDDAVHRALLHEALGPLGFILHAVPDGAGCLRLAAEARAGGAAIDAFLLDVSIRALDGPQMDGWEIARRLRQTGWTVPIIVVSAHPEASGQPEASGPGASGDGAPEDVIAVPHDAFLPKPMNIPALHETLGRLLHLDWITDAAQAALPPFVPEIPEATLDHAASLGPHLAELRRLVRTGHVRALSGRVEALHAASPADERLGRLAASVRAFRLDVAEAILGEEITLDPDR